MEATMIMLDRRNKVLWIIRVQKCIDMNRECKAAAYATRSMSWLALTSLGADKSSRDSRIRS